MVFPVAKLAYLAMKQVSKPLARALQARAKDSPFMKNYILIPPAQSKISSSFIRVCNWN